MGCRVEETDVLANQSSNLIGQMSTDSPFKMDLLSLNMAEGVGFEPTEACDLSGFQDRCNKPLYHPSVYEFFI